MRNKVICYGASDGLRVMYHAVSAIYDIIGISDSNKEKKSIAEKYGVLYIAPDDINVNDFDYIIITSSFENSILQYLLEELKIRREQIITYSEFLKEQKLELGDKNSNQKLYILRGNSAYKGINAMILDYLYCLQSVKEISDYEVLIDTQNYTTIYHDETNTGKTNIIEYYFEKIGDISIEDAYQSKNVTLSMCTTTEEMHKFDYDICFDIQKREQCRKFYKKYFRLNSDMEQVIKEQKEKYIEPYHQKGLKICAVVDRSFAYNYAKAWGHYVQPDIDYSLKKLDELKGEWGFDIILLDTPDEEVCIKFKEHFGDLVIATKRTRVSRNFYKTCENICENRENDKYLQGQELLVSRYLLAACDYFYSGISGSSVLPIVLSENYNDVYIYENGRFGFEEEAIMDAPDKK